MDAVSALKQLGIEELLLPVLIQLIVIILAARVFASLFRAFGQPGVVGEIFAGIILGPSLFLAVMPEVGNAIFKPSIEGLEQPFANVFLPKIFSVLAQLGLIFLLFLIGLEFDFTHLKARGKAAFAISATGIIFPFILGVGVAYGIHGYVEPHPEKGPVPLVGFALFLGVALSITAIPILGRMMMEWGITRTQIGVVTITSAAIDDAFGWILLATVAAAVKTEFNFLLTLKMLGLTLAFGAFMFFICRPIFIRMINSHMRKNNGDIGVTGLAVFIAILLTCAFITNLIGIFAIFGAFLLGAMLSDQQAFREAIIRKLSDIVTAFFLPIFFTNTGLRTQIGTLDSAELWVICGIVIAAALLGKFGGCTIAARLGGFSRKESTIIGVMMNTRALMELIVINVGYDLGVIPKSVFCMLVIMALVTTIMTTPIVMRLMKGTELEEPILRKRSLTQTVCEPELANAV
jgi:Kef-type K+ transport system membrane component KefB